MINLSQKAINRTPQGQGMSLSSQRGFTLIELLAVIAIIAVVAALSIAAFNRVGQGKINARVTAEMESLTAMIESYKAKKGFYPIDNRKDIVTGNPPVTLPNIPTTLYHELTSEPPADTSVFVANSGNEARNFARSLKEGQTRTVEGFKLLGIPTKGPDGDFCYWRYDASTTNRHHQEGFDLWIDVFIKGEKHTFKNWKD